MSIIGIDLAWKSEKNTSALAVGSFRGTTLRIENLYDSLSSLEEIKEVIKNEAELKGVSIDAPLIIPNESGQRICEKELSKEYGSRNASCHTSNKALYPNSASVNLSDFLSSLGFKHLNKDKTWQIECYPHPAVIEIFGLSERHKYKKGLVSEKKSGQIQLAKFIKNLGRSEILKLEFDSSVSNFLDEDTILSKSGNLLKKNEDALDAILCTYIGALFDLGLSNSVFGNKDVGYIYVPQVKCI